MKNLLTILLIAFGCSPWINSQEQFGLKALASGVNQVNGREYVPLSNDFISLELAYDCKLEENLVFYLVVTNETDHTISVNPGTFYYLKLDDPEADSSRFPLCMARPPLKPYKWKDQALEEPRVETFLNPFLEIPAMFMEAFVVSWGSPSVNALEEEQLSRMKDMVRQHMMQEVKLAPGDAANGFVWFPGPPETDYLLFCFPLDDQEFQFAYEVRKLRR